ncbi:MAG: tetratricopeptide repeat protein [Bacteroidia bacterium]|nr:tetratricopeptide repeat protein [Bacteroidia bacterium]
MSFWWKYFLVGLFCLGSGWLPAQDMTARDYFLMGTAKYRCKACNQAVEDFTKAIELNKEYAEAFYGRSLAYTCAKNYPAAITDIDRAIQLSPNQVLYREGKARIKLADGKNVEARVEFEKALRMDSLCWQAWYGIAQVHDNLDSTRLSRKAYEKAVTLNPDFPMAYLGVAETKIKLGDYEGAMPNLIIAAEMAPEYARVYELRSLAQLRRGNFTEAIEDATKATSLDAKNKEAYKHRADSYLAQENYMLADADYTTVLSLDKRDGDAFYRRGICNEKLGDANAAKKFYGKAVKRDKVLKEAYSNRAAIWEQLGKPKKALPDLNQALLLDKNNLSLRLRRGFLLLQLLQIQAASDDFVAATYIDPTSGVAFYGLGLARYQNGNSNDACDAWKTAKKLNEPRAAEELSKYCND